MRAVAPGLAGDEDGFGLAVTLARVMLPCLVLSGPALVLCAMLNGAGRFAAAALLARGEPGAAMGAALGDGSGAGERVALLAALGAAGMGVFVLASVASGAPRLRELVAALSRDAAGRTRRWRVAELATVGKAGAPQ